MNEVLLTKIASVGSVFLLWHFLTLTLCVTGLLLESTMRKGNPHVRSTLLRLTLVVALAVPVLCSIWNSLPTAFVNSTSSLQRIAEPYRPQQTLPDVSAIDWDNIAIWRPMITDLTDLQANFATNNNWGGPTMQIFYATLSGISALVSVYLFARLVLAVFRCIALRMRGKPLEASKEARCRIIASAMGTPVPQMLEVNGLESPVLLGFFKPAILLPDCIEARDEIYWHELTHLRRHDIWWHLFARFATILMPLQPGFWLLKKSLARADEDVCDDMVLVQGANRSNYAELLLKMAESQHLPFPDLCLSMAAFRSQLEHRLHRLMDTARPLADRISFTSLSLCLGPLFVVGILTGAFSIAVTSVEAQTPSPSKLADIPVAVPEPSVPEAVFAQPITMKETGNNPPTRLYYQGGNLILQQELNLSPGSIGQIVFYKHVEVVVDEGGGSPSFSMREILPNDFKIRVQSIAADSVSPAKLRILDSSQEIISEFFIDKAGVMRPVTKAEHDADIALRKEKLPPPPSDGRSSR